jgi:nucleotide-binding universal stress UspA family protein
VTQETSTIVLGYGAQARDALALGAALARATGDRLLLAGPAESLPADIPFDVERRAVAGPSDAAALQALLEAEHPRALVLGSSHRGPLGRVFVGSLAKRLLNGAPCPVVVAPRGFADRQPVALDAVCVGFDDGPESWAAIRRAAQIAAATGAHVRLVMALPPLSVPPPGAFFPPEVEAERGRVAEIALERACRSVSELHPEPRLVNGDPARVLAEQAGYGVDLLVLGSRGHGPLRGVLLGSVSAALMRSAPCPVMVVPRSSESHPNGEGLAADDELVSRR